MLTEAAARTVVVDAFRRKFGRDPTLVEAQCNQAVGKLETVYARGWRGAGAGSYNWGAVQSRSTDPAITFVYVDTHPNPDGSNTKYTVRFVKYPDDVSGCKGMLDYSMRTADERATAMAGDVYGFSAAMYAAKYYEGFGKTREARILNHHKAVALAIRKQCAELSEPLPDLGAPDLPTSAIPLGYPATIRRGSSGEAVRTWQRALGVPADGQFGPLLDEDTRAWQRMFEGGLREWFTKHGKPQPVRIDDGIVGPACWDLADGILDDQYKAAA